VDEILTNKLSNPAQARPKSDRRQQRRQVDLWLHAIEDMLERDQRTVPVSLTREIATFLCREVPPLHQELLGNEAPAAPRVLDILFEAQDALRRA
jgi:hypothetical protein